jgi:hypothetical protein
MVNKIFALASVSALTGLVSAVAAAGCSSNNDPPKATPGVEAGGPSKTGQEAGAPDDNGDPNAPEKSSTDCMETKAIDVTKFPYEKAKKQPNACTAKELDDLSAFFTDTAKKTQDISIKDWENVVSANCAQCVFSDGAGTEWTPILVKGDKLDNVNRGGCIEIASGKEACGRAYQNVAECRLAACTDTCDTPDGFTKCLQDVEGIFTGPCKAAYSSLEKECGTDLPKYEASCKGTSYTFEGPIKVQCIDGAAK